VEVDMKEYFSHDYKARSDRKLINLQMMLGMEGMGCFWSIVEMLYEEDGYLRMEYERIAFELRTEKNVIQQVVEDFELFKNDGESFWSDSIIERLKLRDDKSVKARESVKVRWDKYERNTNVKQPNEGRNTIKESKVNKIKEKESKYNSDVDFDLSFSDPVFLEFLQSWITYKKTTKKPFRNQMEVEACYRELIDLSKSRPEAARKIVDQSISSGYLSLILKNNQEAKSPTRQIHNIATSEDHLKQQLK
jgi:hypothetical protein